MNLNIRPFNINDAEEVSRIITENLTTVNVVDFGDELAEKLSSLYSPEHIINYSRNENIYVGEAGSEIIGTVSLDDCRIRNVFIKPGFHKKGIGIGLMNFIEDTARKKGKEKVFLYSHLSAMEFYSKLGYIFREYINDSFDNKTIQLALMEKYLE